MAKKFIQEMLAKYVSSNPVRFHMPGHKGKVNSFDVTEISSTDNLNNPETYIYDAQQALSKSYGCAHSFFMVNGSTGGVYAMIKYASQARPYPVLISRNCHKSILSACILFDVDTIVIDDTYNNELEAFIFDDGKIIDAINRYQNLSAVVITSVDYFGRVIDLSKISKLCKERGILLLCDEAHGSHFHISNMLPDSSLPYADICSHSPHKTLSALTQCAYVHISDRINLDKFKNIIYSLQTSSPSFLLVKSMDDSRYDAEIMKCEWEDRINRAKELISKLNKIDGIKIAGTAWANQAGYNDKDITRLLIDVSKIGNGIKIGKILESKYNIFMEMCSFKYIVGILTPWDNKEWDERLYTALFEISQTQEDEYSVPNFPQKHNRILRMADAFKSEWDKVLFKDSANKIAATAIGVYPPGVALVLPGETISRETIEYMLEVEKLGGSTFGVDNGYINCVKVVKGEH